MTTTYRRPAQLGLAVVAVLAMLLAAAPARAAEPGTSGTPAEVAADWLATELEAKDGMLTVSFGGPEEFPDQGLTIDAILGPRRRRCRRRPGRRRRQRCPRRQPHRLRHRLRRARRSSRQRHRQDAAAGGDLRRRRRPRRYDLEADLRALMETAGDPTRAASPTSRRLRGNFANGIGQALAILALDRTGGGVPTAAVDYLLDQQCSDGSFRLYQFGYVLSFGPPPVTVDTHSCDDPAEGDADATAFALHGPARACPRRPRSPRRIGGAVDFLLGPAAVVGWLLRHRRGEQQHHGPRRRRAARRG